jgi:hypothetical protein
LRQSLFPIVPPLLALILSAVLLLAAFWAQPLAASSATNPDAHWKVQPSAPQPVEQLEHSTEMLKIKSNTVADVTVATTTTKFRILHGTHEFLFRRS